MTAWTLIQILIDLALGVGLFLLAMRFARASKDDPRLSRGLQVLQNKISVLEDLSDRSESRVRELSEMLDQKAQEAYRRSQLAEEQIQRIQETMGKSLEVIKIFQDRVPHQEIIERQNTIKYVRAARLAHQGMSALEISRQVDLPMGEIEFIAKINRDGLVFDENQLPIWIRESLEQPDSLAVARSLVPPIPRATAETAAASELVPTEPAAEEKLPAPVPVMSSEKRELVEALQRLQSDMRQLGQELARRETRPAAAEPAPLAAAQPELQASREVARRLASPQVRKVQFPRIEKPI